jgi:L-2-hydroxycarboxylate dehydrogenase (NAD+)
MDENKKLVNWESIFAYISKLFEKTGMPSKDAEWTAKTLVDASLWGVDSHGILRVPKYIERINANAINSKPNINFVKSDAAVEIIDGDAGCGAVVGKVAMQKAIDKAAKYSVGMVGAINSNHFGAAACFSRIASDQGMIGITMSNVVPNMVAQGAKKPVVGNNPISVSVPTGGDFPIVFDICLSSIAGGKLLLAQKKGEKIPFGLATDCEGRPTDDPEIGFKGFLLPLGGHKGLGLALIVEILCGVMTGGTFLNDLRGTYTHPNDSSLTCHLMVAINFQALMPIAEMEKRMTHFVRQIKDTPVWEDQEMLLPGELENRSYKYRLKNGIPLPEALFDELITLGQQLDVKATIEANNS